MGRLPLSLRRAHTIAPDNFLGFESRAGTTMRNGHTPTPKPKWRMCALFTHFFKDSGR